MPSGDSVRAFMDKAGRRPFVMPEWIKDGDLECYVRVTKHRVGDVVACTFDVANVKVKQRSRRKGVFKVWLAIVEAECDARGLVVYVESVLNDDLYRFLKARGYEDVPGEVNACPCVYRPSSALAKAQGPRVRDPVDVEGVLRDRRLYGDSYTREDA